MTKILLRKQLAEIFRTYLYDAKKNKARSKGTVIAYFVLFALLMVGLLGGMFTFLAFTLRSTIVSRLRMVLLSHLRARGRMHRRVRQRVQHVLRAVSEPR